MISIIQLTNLLILLPNIVTSNEIIGYRMDYSSEDNYINILPKSNINYDAGNQMYAVVPKRVKYYRIEPIIKYANIMR